MGEECRQFPLTEDFEVSFCSSAQGSRSRECYRISSVDPEA